MALLLTAWLFQDADALLKRLGHDDPAVREAATQELQDLSPESVELDRKLERVASGGDLEAALRARQILSYRRLARKVPDWPDVIQGFRSAHFGERLSAVYTLSKAGVEAAPLLVKATGDSDKHVREAAVLSLAEMDVPELKSIFYEIVKDLSFSFESRYAMLEALAKRGDEFARETVMFYLDPSNQPNNEIRNAWPIYRLIELAAGPFRGEQSLALLVKLSECEGGYLGMIMSFIGDWEEAKRAVYPLVRFHIEREQGLWFINGLDEKALDTFSQLRVPEALPRLHHVLEEGREPAPKAGYVIGKLKDAGAVPLLLRLLKHGRIDAEREFETALSITGAWALGEVGSADAVPSMLELWSQKTATPKRPGTHSELPAMLAALAKIGDDRATPVMLSALRHSEEEVRHAAADALGRMGARSAVRSLVTQIDDIVGFPYYNDTPSKFAVVNGSFRIPQLKPVSTVREAVLEALPKITGAKFEGTQQEQVAAWKAWWKDHQREFP
jgi:HEAT repeat protein